MKACAICLLGVFVLSSAAVAADNKLTATEQEEGWLLLFDGKTWNGWTTDKLKPSKTAIEDGCINPFKCGGYMMIHEKDWADCILKVDFRVSEGCNSGVFFRTFPLETKPKKSIAFNGIEMQVFDGTGTGYHECGALYDLVPNRVHAAKPAGEWNTAEILMQDNVIEVTLNGQKVATMDCNEWTEPNKRPDGTEHKFATAYKDHPRHGYIGLQDHGHPVWYKNIKLKELKK